jgi:hypothetical protein
MKNIDVILTNNKEEVEALVQQGYCPVECSIGGQSITDDLEMDHHGENSELESVAIRAYRDHYGARKEDPRFVVVGVADADASFAIAALAGLIPHPDREVSDKLPPHIKASLTKDLSDLAQTIAILDTDPIGRDVTKMSFGDYKQVWEAMYGQSANDTLGALAAVQGWKTLTTGNPNMLKTYFKAAKEGEEERISAAKKDLEERSEKSDKVLFLNQSETFGFDIWYGRNEENGSPEEVNGWENPVVLAWSAKMQNVTIGCPNKAVAEKIFGQGGLKNVFAHLQPEGWGGRETIGGSPRGMEMTEEQVREAVKVINSYLNYYDKEDKDNDKESIMKQINKEKDGLER